MRFLRLIIAPFRDKIKLQQRANTLELEKKELELVLYNEVFKTITRTLENQDEVNRLTKENHRLRSKIKEMKGDK